MAEIDPVILELRADLNKYRADLRSTTTQVERLLGNQERSVKRLETQMQRSSGAIGASLRGLAGTLGTYFTGRELTGLIDSFTRLQNSLRVAGLEGEALESVQRDLLDLSTRYGVGIEGLANLYGKAADAGRSFGASQADVLQLTEATSQALLITGTSAAQAQGAILGLSQALASGTVRAEEYNQINEGGLRPLLQAAAASERFGGDINKLRAAMLDGKVSSQEFFNSILAGSQQLEGQASKAALTLSGAFEALTSRLTVYIGEGAKANGVTQALASALQLLAENLDTIIPALAIIATVLGGRFLAGALAGGTALKTLAAYASIATTSLAGTALAARSAGAALLAAFGGPVGLAISALVITLGIAASRTDDLSRASSNLKRTNESVSKAVDGARSAVDRLATAYGDARKEALAFAEAQKKVLIGQAILAASDLDKATKAAARAQSNTGRYSGAVDAQTATDLKVARENASNAVRALGQLQAAINAPPSTPPSVSSAGDGKAKKGRKGASGPSAADIEDRFQSELNSIAQQTLSARQALANSAEERAELELRAVELARAAALESLAADKDYSEAQKARVRDALENLAEFERERIARDKRIAQFEEAQDLADAEARAQSDALRQQYDLAESQAERRRLAYQIIELEYQERDAALERIKSNEDLTAAIRQRAAIEQAALRDAQGRTMEAARRDTAGPLENYFDRAKKDADELNEAYQQIAVDGLGSVTDALTETATGFLKLGGVAGKVIDGIISDLIRLAIQQQIVGLFGSLFGGGGLTGTSGGMDLRAFGRASGGPVNAGQVYRVNEAGQEYFQPANSGRIIPVGEMNRRAAAPGAGQSGPIELRIYADEGAFVSRVEAISSGQAVRVVQATAPTIIQGAVGETQRRMSRPRMPGAGR